MGPSGAKMGDFEPFRDSIIAMWPSILALQGKQRAALTTADWSDLQEIFLQISVMQTQIILVAHSKVLAHVLPELVAPIDREYTLNYVYGNTSINQNHAVQWGVFKELHRDFFHPVAANPAFLPFAQALVGQRAHFPWNTSVLKVVDNCVIGMR